MAKNLRSSVVDEESLSLIIDKCLPKIKSAIFESVLESITEVIDKRINEKLTPVLREQQAFKAEIFELREENKRLVNVLNDSEQYSKIDNLVFCGIPLQSYSDAGGSSGRNTTGAESTELSESSSVAENAVILMCKDKLGVTVTPADISCAHRLKTGTTPGAQKDKPPPPLLVRFTNRKIRNEIYSNKKKLADTGLFINEHLTAKNKALHYEARQKVKNKLLHAAWTQGGKIFAKETEHGTKFLYPKK